MTVTSNTLQQIAANAGLPFGTHYNLNWRKTSIGVDCSGFVSAVARTFGASNISKFDWTGSLLPKTQPLSMGSIQPGDLLFFGNPQSVDSHVAIFAGGDTALEASTSIGGVGTGSIASLTKFYGGVVQARRIPQLTAGFSQSVGIPAPLSTSGDAQPSTAVSAVPGMLHVGQAGPLSVSAPSGLLLGLLAIVLLVVGAIAMNGRENNMQLAQAAAMA